MIAQIGKSLKLSLSCLALAALALSALPARAAGDAREMARKMAGENAEAIVTVRVVVSVKVSYNGQQDNDREVKRETSGIIVAPDGSTAVPLSEIDPSQMFERMVSAEDRQQMNMDSKLKDLKLVVNKTTEIPATVVQRDADLDLAIIRPTEKQEKKFKTIDLTNTAEPGLLESCFVLARMGRIGDYVIGAMTGEIQAVVTKPRTFYIPSAELASGGLGVPAFNAEGKLLGVVLNRVTAQSRESSSGDSGSLVVITPASDVKEILDQAQK